MNRVAPELSVVLVTPDRYETIRRTVAHLRAQTARRRLELVIVAPSAGQLGLAGSELDEFAGFRVLEVGEIRSVARARAAGIREASAPLVVLTEDHSFPAPGWAEALIERHRQPWAAVGPVVRNANPDSLISWADFLLGYGAWLESTPGREVDHLPGHNTSYKRAALRDYDQELEAMLEAESVLHWTMRARGARLYLEPAAVTAHLNFSRFRPWIRYLLPAARVFAAARSRQWSPLRRLAYAAGAPLIPLVRLRRIASSAHRPGVPAGLWLRVAPPLLLGLALDAVGQALGYALGPGTASQKLCPAEFHRERHVRSRAVPGPRAS